MPKTMRKNESPTATFNLRETGPLKPDEIDKRMKGWRVALRFSDPHATVDPTPCPHCQSLVEWAPTSAKVGHNIVRYIYARCKQNKAHAWGFRAHTPPAIIDVTPPPRPSAGAQVMTRWIDSRLGEIEKELHHLREIRRLANEITPYAVRPANGREEGS